ncbi:hypothetical protein N1851_003507 [Merluccius polli]|uniref:Uncharacterized protein n=1 Tax=Merluccius polli TaxID=89951 RepID=A0AA47PBK4_MERPO|nr:hypothetical protein N1851_003507 [Merluccius polli]
MACPFIDDPVEEGAQILHRAFTPPAPRVFRDRSNPLGFPDEYLWESSSQSQSGNDSRISAANQQRVRDSVNETNYDERVERERRTRNVLIFLRGAAPRRALGRLGRVRGLPGAADAVSRCAFLSPLTGGRGRGPLAPGVTVDRDGLSSVRPNRVASFRAGIRLTYNWRKGSAAMSATHPTRLETWTKESNARASQRVLRNPAAQ